MDGAGRLALAGCRRPIPVREGSSGTALGASRGMIKVDTHAPPPGSLAMDAGVAGYRIRYRPELAVPWWGRPRSGLCATELCGIGDASHRRSGRRMPNQPGACRKVGVCLSTKGAGRTRPPLIRFTKKRSTQRTADSMVPKDMFIHSLGQTSTELPQPLTQSPWISREMTRRWISLVPSPISHTLASRIIRSTG